MGGALTRPLTLALALAPIPTPTLTPSPHPNPNPNPNPNPEQVRWTARKTQGGVAVAAADRKVLYLHICIWLQPASYGHSLHHIR